MKSSFLFALLATLTTATSFATTILPGPETPLQSIINSNVTGTTVNVNTDQVLNDAYWQADGTVGTYLLIELAGYAPNNAFGIYDKVTGAKQQILAGNAVAGAYVASVVVPWNTFGFYLKNTAVGFTYYSDPALNAGSLDHFVVFGGKNGATLKGKQFGANDYIVAMEDLSLGDKDYNDMVVLVQNIRPPVVPDAGATAGLLGLGLLGLSVLRRKTGSAK